MYILKTNTEAHNMNDIDTTDILEFIEDTNSQFDELVQQLPNVSAAEINLDPRAGKVYVDVENYLIIVHDRFIRTINYYGGFEYVNEDAITKFGNYTIFHADDNRVESAISYFEENNC